MKPPLLSVRVHQNSTKERCRVRRDDEAEGGWGTVGKQLEPEKNATYSGMARRVSINRLSRITTFSTK